VFVTAFIVTADYIYDYFMQSYRFKFEIILHGIFMMIWGAILGYLTAKYKKGNP
jgi:ABC-type multidrug transport system permease subunit